ncbi:MAG: PRC-barrel domain-containing protein [Clostridiales bacterium]|nr:PRC-barrel domain-containing protein [Clostridiales bacterium]
MEITFSELKQRDVINLIDGKHMGKVCDISFTFPKGDVLGFTVTGCKGFRFSKQEIFLPIKSVVKIGQDAVLVKFGKEEPPPSPPGPPRCPPPNNPPNCPPNFQPPQNRRNYDEYE